MRTLILAGFAALALLVVPATSAQASSAPAASAPVSAPLGATMPITDAGKAPVTQKAGTQDFENCGCRRYRVRYYRVRYHRVRYYRVRYAVRYWVYRY